MDEPLNVENIFEKELKAPFTYNLHLDLVDTNDKLFELIKNIFVKGLVILYGDGTNIDISNVTPSMIEKLSEYMLSLGIKVFFKSMNAKEKDFLFRSFLYDVEKIKELKITVNIDWRTNLINSIHINVDKAHEHVLDTVKDITRKYHYISNHYLKIYSPKVLRDHAIMINKKGHESIIYFDFPKLGDYVK